MLGALSLVFLPVARAVRNVDTCVLYPIKGIKYFITHPVLWGNLFMLAIPQLVLTAVVVIVAFSFLFPAQAAFAFLLNGPAGIVASFIGMFQQSMNIVRSISELFLFPKPMRILFDGVLVQEGMDNVILTGRRQAPEKFDQSDYRRVITWGKSLPRKLLFPTWFGMIVVRFLLSFVPILGPLILIVLDGPSTAERCLGRYFELKGWSSSRIEAFISDNRYKYLLFGLLAATLETVPIVGFAFAFTNTIGGALWAVKIERGLIAQDAKSGRLNLRKKV